MKIFCNRISNNIIVDIMMEREYEFEPIELSASQFHQLEDEIILEDYNTDDLLNHKIGDFYTDFKYLEPNDKEIAYFIEFCESVWGYLRDLIPDGDDIDIDYSEFDGSYETAYISFVTKKSFANNICIIVRLSSHAVTTTSSKERLNHAKATQVRLKVKNSIPKYIMIGYNNKEKKFNPFTQYRQVIEELRKIVIENMSELELSEWQKRENVRILKLNNNVKAVFDFEQNKHIGK